MFRAARASARRCARWQGARLTQRPPRASPTMRRAVPALSCVAERVICVKAQLQTLRSEGVEVDSMLQAQLEGSGEDEDDGGR
mmetsp:Transcript_17219/g.65712  ORF Transcript_17219/g.65712 Transcript_17219/m.65712 type:complete len:83 (+) Transcript_17219:95-343(+)